MLKVRGLFLCTSLYMMFRKIRHPSSFFNILVTEKPIRIKFSEFVAEKKQEQKFFYKILPFVKYSLLSIR